MYNPKTLLNKIVCSAVATPMLFLSLLGPPAAKAEDRSPGRTPYKAEESVESARDFYRAFEVSKILEKWGKHDKKSMRSARMGLDRMHMLGVNFYLYAGQEFTRTANFPGGSVEVTLRGNDSADDTLEVVIRKGDATVRIRDYLADGSFDSCGKKPRYSDIVEGGEFGKPRCIRKLPEGLYQKVVEMYNEGITRVLKKMYGTP